MVIQYPQVDFPWFKLSDIQFTCQTLTRKAHLRAWQGRNPFRHHPLVHSDNLKITEHDVHCLDALSGSTHAQAQALILSFR